MSYADAVRRLSFDLAQHEADTKRLGGYPRRLMLVDVETAKTIVDSRMPLGVLEAERLRAERSGDGVDRTAPAGTGAGVSPENGAESSVRLASASAPSPLPSRRCGRYGAAPGFEFFGDRRAPASHECRLEAGHQDPCQCACGELFTPETE